MEKRNRAPKQCFSKGGTHTTEGKKTVAWWYVKKCRA